MEIDGRGGTATAINGSVPGPLIHLREGDDVELNITNRMMDVPHSSIHWHGILVPFRMDGVPGVNFGGIPPGETYRYRYRVRQAGTYWYHSHSRFQEQTGAYGPLVIDPKDGEPFAYERDYPVVMGTVLVTTVFFVACTTAADLINALLDPRLREPNGPPARLDLSADDRQALVDFLLTLDDPEVTTAARFGDPFRR